MATTALFTKRESVTDMGAPAVPATLSAPPLTMPAAALAAVLPEKVESETASDCPPTPGIA